MVGTLLNFNMEPENRPGPKGKDSLPSIIFQGKKVVVSEIRRVIFRNFHPEKGEMNPPSLSRFFSKMGWGCSSNPTRI